MRQSSKAAKAPDTDVKLAEKGKSATISKGTKKAKKSTRGGY